MISKKLTLPLVFALIAGAPLPAVAEDTASAHCPSIIDHTMKRLHRNEQIELCAILAGSPVLIVNTASHCGFTPQFEGLEELFQTYREEGLQVLGVPSDDFRQAARDEAEAAEICYLNFGVSFTMVSHQAVTGRDAHPLFQALAAAAGEPKWNFNKYLLDADGTVMQRFDSRVKPMSAEIRQAVEKLL